MQAYSGLATTRGKPSGLVAKNTHTEGFWKSVHRSVDRSVHRSVHRSVSRSGVAVGGNSSHSSNSSTGIVPFRRRVTKMMPIGVPRVPYRTPRESSWQWVDIWNCLYRERIIFLSKPVDDELGNQLVATMLYLDSEDQKPLNLYINCSGGQVVPCLAIHDTMRHIRSPVGTVGFGGCMGMSGFLLAVGERGRRNVLQNTHVMIHHPSGTARGQASDMNREAQELLRIRDYMDVILASSTGQPYDKVAYDLQRNKYFDAQEALEYGIVDNIVKPARAMAQL